MFRKRGFTECVINNKIHIRNVHLNHQQHFLDRGRQSIENQINESFSNLNCEHNIIVGDFNIENFKYPNDFMDTNNGPTYRKDNPLNKNLKRDKRIDFIFTKNIKVISSKKVTNLESDHDGLFIHFQI
jgi:endonuclease/exonuclease/phosphatase family metal-dependent hydrolase